MVQLGQKEAEKVRHNAAYIVIDLIEGLPPMPPTPEFQLYIQCVGSV